MYGVSIDIEGLDSNSRGMLALVLRQVARCDRPQRDLSLLVCQLMSKDKQIAMPPAVGLKKLDEERELLLEDFVILERYRLLTVGDIAARVSQEDLREFGMTSEGVDAISGLMRELGYDWE